MDFYPNCDRIALRCIPAWTGNGSKEEFNMKNSFKPRQMTLLGLLCGIIIIMSVTPLGYLRFGALSITLNMIPVAIAAVAMGPLGGAITGLVFGLTSFFAALTGGSSMGIIMMNISPALTFVQSVLPRLAMGICVGLLYRWMHRVTKKGMAAYAAGFSAAFLNTLFYMTSLVVLFGNTEYVQGLIGGRNIIVFMCAFVGFNAVFEIICATVVTGILGKTLEKARLLGR